MCTICYRITMKFRIIAVFLLIIGALVGYYVYNQAKPFSLGLDLAGGTELIYTADISAVGDGDVNASMSALRDVIERRVNLFGVSEPVVQVERGGIFGQGTYQLRVELPGITDVEEAVQRIGETPSLEFKLMDQAKMLELQKQIDASSVAGATTTAPTQQELEQGFVATGLGGKYVERAQLVFNNQAGRAQPIVSLTFNDQGAQLFADITAAHIGEPLAIFLDGSVISSPVIQESITGGTAQISGNFTLEEARALVRNLNYGALPMPIELESTQSIGPSLGSNAIQAGIFAGIVGFIALSIFLVLWYRIPGLIAVVALVLYVAISLALFKLIPVTLTAAGIAGFILSIGMAVDANVLIFERTKEEMKKGKQIHESLKEGFARAWMSIRDSNISSLITSVVLFWLGTSAVKGFALTLGVGVLISMFTAITVSRTFLLAIAPKKNEGLMHFLFSNGVTK